MRKELFGKTKGGEEVYLYYLENKSGMQAKIMNYGANLVSLLVPDKDGNLEDVVLGYDSVAEYEENGDFFGCTIGPNANRTKDAAYSIDGIDYKMDRNDNNNNLHSHRQLGFHKKMWQMEQLENVLKCSLAASDGEIGFPGNRKIEVTYTLTEQNELKIHYEAKSDKKTIFNLTNHSYFNLEGHHSGTIENQLLTLFASHYTPILEDSIPTGEIATVKGTPMDFTTEKPIGQDIQQDWQQLQIANGYDHNYRIDDCDGTLKKAAILKDPKSGRVMETYTDLPGIQIYSGNYIDNQHGKRGAVYPFRGGVCFETQYDPNSANEDSFPDIVYGPDRIYASTTVYAFRTEK